MRHDQRAEDTVLTCDTQLRRDLLEELIWDPRIGEAELGIAVKDGMVTLTGIVESYAQKYAAERAVERVTGVRALAEDLDVRLPASRQRTDGDIALSAVNALDGDVEVPLGRIGVTMDHGWLHLDGCVEWQYQKGAAERAVRYLNGIRGVTNDIAVKPRTALPIEASQRIRDALRRSAELDASRIAVESADGEVTLRGSVRSCSERADAERAAWSAPGVSVVNDLLAIND